MTASRQVAARQAASRHLASRQVEKVVVQVRRQAGQFQAAVSAFVRSRIAVGVSAAMLVAFLAHAAFTPDRLPPFAALGLAQMGVVPPPPAVDLSDLGVSDASVRQQTHDLLAAGTPVLARYWEQSLARAPWLIPALNIAGLLAACAALTFTMLLQTRKPPPSAPLSAGPSP